MKVKVRTLRQLGRNLHKEQLKDVPGCLGELRAGDERDPELGRQVTRARLLDISRSAEHDILPQLNDARLIWVEGGKMRFTGTERREGAEYGQTWSVEVV